VDNDSAEVTSSGRSFRESPDGDGCQLSQWHCQTVGASRTERSAARQVDDIVEWTKVLRCESVQDFVDENGNLVLNSLRHFREPENFQRANSCSNTSKMPKLSMTFTLNEDSGLNAGS